VVVAVLRTTVQVLLEKIVFLIQEVQALQLLVAMVEVVVMEAVQVVHQ
jgi:hypothetical protein